MFTREQFAHICGVSFTYLEELMTDGYLEQGLTLFEMKHIRQVRLIQRMQSFGFKREDIEMVLLEQIGIDDVLKLRIYEIQNSIERGYQLIDQIKRIRSEIDEGQPFVSDLKISAPTIEQLPERKTCSIRQKVHPHAINYLLKRLQDKMKAYGLKPSGNLIRRVHGSDSTMDHVDMELIYPVAVSDRQVGEHVDVMPSQVVASVDVIGDYDALSMGYSTLYQWLENENYQIAGPCFEEFQCGILTKEGLIPHIQIDSAKEPMQFKVRLCIPIHTVGTGGNTP